MDEQKIVPPAPPPPPTRIVCDSINPEVQSVARYAKWVPDHVAIYLFLVLCIAAAWVLGTFHGEDTAKKFYTERIAALRVASDKALEDQRNESGALIRALGQRLNHAEKTRTEVKTIVKEVNHYVTQKSDAACTVPAGFVWMYNAGLAGELPGLPGDRPQDVDAPAGVALSTVAAVATDNNAESVERGAIVAAWQEWYVTQKEIYERARARINQAAKELK